MATDTKDTEKPLSMREIVEQFREQSKRTNSFIEQLKRAEDAAAVRKPYTEADALARCIDALQDLKAAEETRRPNASYSSPMNAWDSYRQTWAPGERVLRFLADRFGVSLIEVQRPECNRPHLDEISPDQFFNALRMAGGEPR